MEGQTHHGSDNHPKLCQRLGSVSHLEWQRKLGTEVDIVRQWSGLRTVEMQIVALAVQNGGWMSSIATQISREMGCGYGEELMLHFEDNFGTPFVDIEGGITEQGMTMGTMGNNRGGKCNPPVKRADLFG